uniref:Cytochrome b561, DM13 and DOMON domain-containing protein n=1 Tax=Ananas comosus var. bracteatus TaxID=296719 RepID=A0A6V7QAI5_ANACO|nr:unnamed protein product [Ananas comosus var. bracteatus]
MADPLPLLILVLVLVLLTVASSAAAAAAAACRRNTSLAGFEAELAMAQHQLRGVVRVVDGCSLSVRGFDMLAGSAAVRWWGAAGADLRNLSLGAPVSDLPLNRTFRGENLTVPLLPGASLDALAVLAVWDPATASDFGHIIGLESAVRSDYYMAFGWAAPGSSSPSMIHADAAVTGFTEEGLPFAEDYFITQYSECLLNKDGKVEGVCPDTIYEGSDPVGLVNNTKLIYGHRRDGVSFVRYERPIISVDDKYDVPINKTDNMTVIWALGQMLPPDSLRPYYLPQNHGGPQETAFGFRTLNLSEPVMDCVGPLDAEDKEDQDLISADGKTPLVVTSGPALRGVPVKFSIQAGHDVALYITSDPIGGNATSRNATEVIYAGGPESEGVPASPTELVWLPDRNTPDQVYYHSLYEQKMGWKVQVVDGGISDMYNNSVVLDDQQVSLFWTLSDGSISIAARGEKKSGYLAIGFGTGMVNSYAYVGWIDSNGTGRVNSYWIDGKDAMNVHSTSENLTYVRCHLGHGARWSDDNLNNMNMHSVTSSKPVRVLLLRGSAEAEQDLHPVLGVHGFMMFVSWGLLLPGGILAARYLKHVKGDGWFQIHVYLQYSGIAIMLLGVLFAAAELRGFYLSSLHVKFGVTAIALACAQPLNAYFRPKRPANGEVASSRRILWEYLHVIIGRSSVVVGVVALFSGMKQLGHRYGGENVKEVTWALILWVLLGAVLVLYLEYMEIKRRRSERNSFRGTWVLGNSEEDDSVDLLHPEGATTKPESNSSGIMEVQLEPLTG